MSTLPHPVVADVKRGLGSLAAANAMLLVVPATRNSLLTLLVGLPFDQVIIYHRALGRIAIGLTLAHGNGSRGTPHGFVLRRRGNGVRS